MALYLDLMGSQGIAHFFESCLGRLSLGLYNGKLCLQCFQFIGGGFEALFLGKKFRLTLFISVPVNILKRLDTYQDIEVAFAIVEALKLLVNLLNFLANCLKLIKDCLPLTIQCLNFGTIVPAENVITGIANTSSVILLMLCATPNLALTGEGMTPPLEFLECVAADKVLILNQVIAQPVREFGVLWIRVNIELVEK